MVLTEQSLGIQLVKKFAEFVFILKNLLSDLMSYTHLHTFQI